MKKFFSTLTRSVLSTIVVLAIVAGGAYAYVALTATGQVTVDEPLSWVGDNTFSVNIYPQESTSESLTLANASSADLLVDFITTIDPDPGTKGLTITVPKNLNVPGAGQASFTVDVVAGKSAVPGTYVITIDVDR